jgi:O-antigen ligase
LAIGRGTEFLIMCGLAQTITSHARVDQLHRFAHGFLVLMAGAVALGYVSHGPLNQAVAGRFHWLYVHPVPAGIYLMCGFLIAAAYTRSAALRGVVQLWPRWVYVAFAAWIGLALVLTKTRGSLGGALVGIVVLILWHTRTRTKLDVGLMAVSSIAAIVALAGPAIITYLERGETLSKLATLNSRTSLWSLAFDKFKERPFQGYGLGASRGIFLEEIRLGGGHNAFINALVDTGLVGLCALLAILGLVFWSLWTFRRGTVGYRDSLLLLPLMVGLCVNAMTAEFLAVPANTASLWLIVIVGWIGVLHRAEASIRAANQPARTFSRV